MNIYTEQYNSMSQAKRNPKGYEINTSAPNGRAWKSFAALTDREERYFKENPNQVIEIYKLILNEKIAYVKDLDSY